MRCSVLALLLLGSVGACDASSPAERHTGPKARSAGLALAETQSPRVALLATRPGAAESSLHFVLPGSESLPDPAAVFAHAPDGEVRGRVVPSSSRVVVVADMVWRREPSFGAWLLGVQPGHEPVVLAKGCYHASRPLVLPSGRVLVQRGASGPEVDGALRVDSLQVDEIDPETGAQRTLHEYQGYITHLAGSLDGEVFLYRVAQQSADLVAVNIESGAVRVLAGEIPAQARDFSVDPSARALVYTNHDGAGWLVERLSLDSGARQPLLRAEGMWVTPSVWPGGGLLVNDGRGAVVHAGLGPTRPLGPGFDEVLAVSASAAHVALLHRVPSGFSRPFVVASSTGKVQHVPAPPESRIDIAGFLP